LTGWICWFVFLPFILFDFRKTSQCKNFQKIQCATLSKLSRYEADTQDSVVSLFRVNQDISNGQNHENYNC
jgi:hypothetical protein